MKTILTFLATLGSAALLALVVAPHQSSGQAGNESDTATATLIADVTVQQALLVENQVKIDDKIAAIAEEVRLARLHVSRGGGK